ncbi:hypothetical protein DUGA2_62790 [Duganella sp. HH101]|nr:hypothetical protein DUGA2_62790 [Duganella sp. HH101]
MCRQRRLRIGDLLALRAVDDVHAAGDFLQELLSRHQVVAAFGVGRGVGIRQHGIHDVVGDLAALGQVAAQLGDPLGLVRLLQRAGAEHVHIDFVDKGGVARHGTAECFGALAQGNGKAFHVGEAGVDIVDIEPHAAQVGVGGEVGGGAAEQCDVDLQHTHARLGERRGAEERAGLDKLVHRLRARSGGGDGQFHAGPGFGDGVERRLGRAAVGGLVQRQRAVQCGLDAGRGHQRQHLPLVVVAAVFPAERVQIGRARQRDAYLVVVAGLERGLLGRRILVADQAVHDLDRDFTAVAGCQLRLETVPFLDCGRAGRHFPERELVDAVDELGVGQAGRAGQSQLGVGRFGAGQHGAGDGVPGRRRGAQGLVGAQVRRQAAAIERAVEQRHVHARELGPHVLHRRRVGGGFGGGAQRGGGGRAGRHGGLGLLGGGLRRGGGGDGGDHRLVDGVLVGHRHIRQRQLAIAQRQRHLVVEGLFLRQQGAVALCVVGDVADHFNDQLAAPFAFGRRVDGRVGAQDGADFVVAERAAFDIGAGAGDQPLVVVGRADAVDRIQGRVLRFRAGQHVCDHSFRRDGLQGVAPEAGAAGVRRAAEQRQVELGDPVVLAFQRAAVLGVLLGQRAVGGGLLPDARGRAEIGAEILDGVRQSRLQAVLHARLRLGQRALLCRRQGAADRQHHGLDQVQHHLAGSVASGGFGDVVLCGPTGDVAGIGGIGRIVFQAAEAVPEQVLDDAGAGPGQRTGGLGAAQEIEHQMRQAFALVGALHIDVQADQVGRAVQQHAVDAGQLLVLVGGRHVGDVQRALDADKGRFLRRRQHHHVLVGARREQIGIEGQAVFDRAQPAEAGDPVRRALAPVVDLLAVILFGRLGHQQQAVDQRADAILLVLGPGAARRISLQHIDVGVIVAAGGDLAAHQVVAEIGALQSALLEGADDVGRALQVGADAERAIGLDQAAAEVALGIELRQLVDAVAGVAQPGVAGAVVAGVFALLFVVVAAAVDLVNLAEGVIGITLHRVGRRQYVAHQVDVARPGDARDLAQHIVGGKREGGFDRIDRVVGIGHGAPLLGRAAELVVRGIGGLAFGIEHLDGASGDVVGGGGDTVAAAVVGGGGLAGGGGGGGAVGDVDAYHHIAEDVAAELGQRAGGQRQGIAGRRRQRRLAPGGDRAHAAERIVVAVAGHARGIGAARHVAQRIVGIAGGGAVADLAGFTAVFVAVGGDAIVGGVDRRLAVACVFPVGLPVVVRRRVVGLTGQVAGGVVFKHAQVAVARGGVVLQRGDLRLLVAVRIVVVAGAGGAGDRRAVAGGAVDQDLARLAEGVVAGFGGARRLQHLLAGQRVLVVHPGQRFDDLDRMTHLIVAGDDGAGWIADAGGIERQHRAPGGELAARGCRAAGDVAGQRSTVAGQLGHGAEVVARIAGHIAGGVDVVAHLAETVIDLVAEVAVDIFVGDGVAQHVVADLHHQLAGIDFVALGRGGGRWRLICIVDIDGGLPGADLAADEIVLVRDLARLSPVGAFGAGEQIAQHVVGHRGLRTDAGRGARAPVRVGVELAIGVDIDFRRGLQHQVAGVVVGIVPGLFELVDEAGLSAQPVVAVGFLVAQRIGGCDQIALGVIVGVRGARRAELGGIADHIGVAQIGQRRGGRVGLRVGHAAEAVVAVFRQVAARVEREAQAAVLIVEVEGGAAACAGADGGQLCGDAGGAIADLLGVDRGGVADQGRDIALVVVAMLGDVAEGVDFELQPVVEVVDGAGDAVVRLRRRLVGGGDRVGRGHAFFVGGALDEVAARVIVEAGDGADGVDRDLQAVEGVVAVTRGAVFGGIGHRRAGRVGQRRAGGLRGGVLGCAAEVAGRIIRAAGDGPLHRAAGTVLRHGHRLDAVAAVVGVVGGGVGRIGGRIISQGVAGGRQAGQRCGVGGGDAQVAQGVIGIAHDRPVAQRRLGRVRRVLGGGGSGQAVGAVVGIDGDAVGRAVGRVGERRRAAGERQRRGVGGPPRQVAVAVVVLPHDRPLQLAVGGQAFGAHLGCQQATRIVEVALVVVVGRVRRDLRQCRVQVGGREVDRLGVGDAVGQLVQRVVAVDRQTAAGGQRGFQAAIEVVEIAARHIGGRRRDVAVGDVLLLGGVDAAEGVVVHGAAVAEGVDDGALAAAMVVLVAGYAVDRGGRQLADDGADVGVVLPAAQRRQRGGVEAGAVVGLALELIKTVVGQAGHFAGGVDGVGQIALAVVVVAALVTQLVGGGQAQAVFVVSIAAAVTQPDAVDVFRLGGGQRGHALGVQFGDEAALYVVAFALRAGGAAADAGFDQLAQLVIGVARDNAAGRGLGLDLVARGVGVTGEQVGVADGVAEAGHLGGARRGDGDRVVAAAEDVAVEVVLQLGQEVAVVQRAGQLAPGVVEVALVGGDGAGAAEDGGGRRRLVQVGGAQLDAVVQRFDQLADGVVAVFGDVAGRIDLQLQLAVGGVVIAADLVVRAGRVVERSGGIDIGQLADVVGAADHLGHARSLVIDVDGQGAAGVHRFRQAAGVVVQLPAAAVVGIGVGQAQVGQAGARPDAVDRGQQIHLRRRERLGVGDGARDLVVGVVEVGGQVAVGVDLCCLAAGFVVQEVAGGAILRGRATQLAGAVVAVGGDAEHAAVLVQLRDAGGAAIAVEGSLGDQTVGQRDAAAAAGIVVDRGRGIVVGVGGRDQAAQAVVGEQGAGLGFAVDGLQQLAVLVVDVLGGNYLAGDLRRGRRQ